MLRGSSFLFVAPWSQLCKGSQQFLSQGLMGGLLVNTSPPPRICLMPATGHWTSGFQTWVCLRIIREAHFKCSICPAEIHYVWAEELTNFNKQLAESDAWVKNSTLGTPGWNLENREKGALVTVDTEFVLSQPSVLLSPRTEWADMKQHS